MAMFRKQLLILLVLFVAFGLRREHQDYTLKNNHRVADILSGQLSLTGPTKEGKPRQVIDFNITK